MRISAWPQAVVTPLAIAVLSLFGPSKQAAGEQKVVGAIEHASADDIIVEWHQVSVTVQQALDVAQATRHDIEHERLLSVMSRQHGEWTSNHPRHRLLDALHGFSRYYERQWVEVDRLRGLYKNVSPSQKKFLEEHLDYASKFRDVEQKLANNQHVCDDIVEASLAFYNIPSEELQKHMRDREAEGRQAERIPVSQALKHIVRDWTEEGDHERNGPFACVLGSLRRQFPDRRTDVEDIRVLLPGAGLGRLGYDISRLGGFEVTINEWSMYMNAAFRFLEAQQQGQALSQSVSPFVDGWSHHATNDNMLRALRFPDVALPKQTVLMVEGDFTTEFRNYTQHFDVVLTYFFIDTARNLMSYFDTIKHVLKQGGIWMNLGPLLYGTAPFVQLTLEDVITVSEKMGFEFLETDEQCGPRTFATSTVRSIEAIYNFDHRALTQNAYKAQFWMARKS